VSAVESLFQNRECSERVQRKSRLSEKEQGEEIERRNREKKQREETERRNREKKQREETESLQAGSGTAGAAKSPLDRRIRPAAL
jgi:hypothetical protein